MTLAEVMKELASLATPSTKKTLLRHGAPEPVFGVRIGDMKPLLKKLKGRQELALELYATGNYDAMYLAGLFADGTKMTREQLESWVAGALWHAPAGCIVPPVAAEHPDGFAIARKWIDSPRELTATAGWATLASIVSTVPDEKLPLQQIAVLLDRVGRTIATERNRVRYTMNNFLIACGTFVGPLADDALAIARRIGCVEVDMGDTACQVPEPAAYILKCRRGAPVAPKRRGSRC